MKARRARLAAVSVIALAAACSTITPIGTDARCGNSVIDAGEDCDRFARLGMACRAEGTDGQCRFDCSPDAKSGAHQCATSYGCGLDAICRAPKGVLQGRGDLPIDASTLVATDFDQDGLPDLLVTANGKASVVFMGEGFHSDKSTDAHPLAHFAPYSIGEITADELPDIAFIDNYGLGVLRGSVGRELAGTAYPTFPIPDGIEGLLVWRLHAVPSLAGDQPLAFVQLGSDLSGATIVLLVDPSSIATAEFGISTLGGLPQFFLNGTQIVDRVVSGDLDPLTPCDEYVLAYRTTNRVLVGTACTQSGDVNGGVFQPPIIPSIPIQPIEIDLSACETNGNAFPVANAFAVDANDDGFDDLVITPDASSDLPSCLVVGPLKFANPVTMTQASPAVGVPFPQITLRAGERALAIRDINADKIPDLVTSQGIFLSQPPVVPQPSCLATNPARVGDPAVVYCDDTPTVGFETGAITSVAIGDMNANALLDVAVTDDVTQRVVLESSKGDGTFSSFELPANGFPNRVVAGDFDGDGVDDIAFGARACKSTGCEEGQTDGADTLSVAYGRVAGGPESPVSIGQLGHIQEMLSASFAPHLTKLDGADDLGVLFTDFANPGRRSFATLFGSTQREIQAPFVIYDPGLAATPADDLDFAPAAVTMGQLAELDESGIYVPSPAPGQTPLHRDIATVAFALAPGGPKNTNPLTNPRMWLLASEGEAELSGTHSWASARLTNLIPEWDPLTSDLTSANLDADATDELVDIGGNGFILGNVEEVTADDGTQHPEIMLTAVPTPEYFESSAWFDSGRSPNATLRFGVDVRSPLIVEDIDGDGSRDVAALGWRADGAQVLVVYWNQGGSFEANRSTSVVLQSPTTALLAFNFDQDEELEIVLADANGGSLVDIAAASPRALQAPVRIPGIPAGSPPATSLAAADFDRDGVVDLAIGHAGSITLYRSLPVIE